MAKKILIGIDLGTTMLKAAAFDARTGSVLAVDSERLKTATDPDGKQEQETESLDRSLKKTLRSIRKSLGESAWRAVEGIGLASQAGSAILVDRETGDAHTPMMLWSDMRPYPLIPKIGAQMPRGYWQRLAMNEQPGAGLARMVWLRERYPKLFGDRCMYVGAGEYLYFRLTGVWRQDAGNALQQGCYRVSREDIDPAPLKLVGVQPDFVAPMRQGHELHPLWESGAAELGLREGVPVAGPYFDHEGGFLTTCGILERPLECSLGTAWVGDFMLPAGVKGRSTNQLILPAPVGEGKMICQPLRTGNVVWDWGLRALADRSHSRAIAKLDKIFGESLLPPDGMVALPYFNQRNLLRPDYMGSGVFSGMSVSTEPHDMLRALALGLSCELRRTFESVAEAHLLGGVVLAGGAAKGEFFRTMIAALFAPLPVYCLTEDFMGARGALYAFSRKTATSRATRVRRPGARVRRQLEEAMDLYREVYQRMYGNPRENGAYMVNVKKGETR